MPVLRAPPGASFFVNRRRYSATASGEVRVDPKHAEDVAALLNAGCVATAPWFHSVPPPAKPAPPPRATVRLKAPRPHAAFAPVSASSVRYVADADGHFDAAPEHVKALIRAGCCVVT